MPTGAHAADVQHSNVTVSKGTTRTRLLCLGNPIVNRAYLGTQEEAESAGYATLVDEQEMSSLLAGRACITTSSGGSLLTTALALGQSHVITFTGALGDDSSAAFLRETAANQGVILTPQVFPDERTAECAVLKFANGERSLYTSPSAAALLGVDGLPDEAFDLLIMEGYTLQGKNGGDLLEWFVRSPSPWKILTLSAVEVAAEYAESIRAAASAARCTLFGTVEEAIALVTDLVDVRDDAITAGDTESLAKALPDWEVVLTNGALPAWHAREGRSIASVSPHASTIGDRTGAGDHFLAGWLDATLEGASAHESLLRGHAFASRAISGAAPRAQRMVPPQSVQIARKDHI